MGRGRGRPREDGRDSVQLGLHPHRGSAPPSSWFRGLEGRAGHLPSSPAHQLGRAGPERGGSFGGRTRHLSGFMSPPRAPGARPGAQTCSCRALTPDSRPVGTWAPWARVPHWGPHHSPGEPAPSALACPQHLFSPVACPQMSVTAIVFMGKIVLSFRKLAPNHFRGKWPGTCNVTRPENSQSHDGDM